MRISNAHMRQFTALYEAEFGVVLSEEEALEAGEFVIKLIRAVYGNVDTNPSSHYENSKFPE